MAKKEKFDIRVTTEELRLNLQKIIKSEFSSLVASVLIDNLSETEVGLEQLYKAISGMGPLAKFKIFDKVLVDMGHLPSWRLDKEKTNALLFKGKMKAEITEVNLQRKSVYMLRYSYIDSSGSEAISETWPVEEHALELLSDDFIDDDNFWPK